MRPTPIALAFACTVTLVGALQPPRALAAQEATPVNRVVELLQQGRPAMGTFTRTARPDLDFAVIDEQYGDFDIDGVREAVVAIRTGSGGSAITPVVRIPLAARDAPEAVVRQVLEAGALGVMFPDIETRAQAVAAVNSMRVAQAGGQALVAMLQIETLAGIERLDEILDVPGIGVIFLGPTDLAASAGEDGPNAPRVDALVQEVLKACLARDIPCGYPIVARSPEDAERQTARRLAEGFRVLAVMTSAR
jgi:4-hydroxy-2-oxoheptanedioate aldolase